MQRQGFLRFGLGDRQGILEDRNLSAHERLCCGILSEAAQRL